MTSYANTLIVLDFETTGLSPDAGDRAIEIGAVRIENGKITERFQELMHPGRRISAFIEDYTGISNAMLADARSCAAVMADFADFIQGYNLLAHNAAFDRRFLDAELKRIDRDYTGDFVCSLLVSRRIFQQAPSYKLESLVQYANIAAAGSYHRALYDSEMTAKLWLSILAEISRRSACDDIPFSLVKKIAKTPKKKIETILK